MSENTVYIDDGAAAVAASSKKSKERSGPPAAVLVIVAIVAVLAIAGGVLWWLNARQFEATDDAFIDTNIVNVAPRASGQVVAVMVTDNQPVKTGQLLVQLDDSNARTQLAQAQAVQASALAQIAQAQAQVVVSEAQADQSQANTRGPAALAAQAVRDYNRDLVVQADAPDAVSAQQVDQAATTMANDQAQLLSARKQVQTSLAQVASSRTQLGAGQAQLQTAQAQIDQAQLQIDYARIIATADGHVAHKTIAVGNYVQAGQQVMSLVPAVLWVTANFKETQLKRIRVGQAVDLQVDAYPNVRFRGHVDSIQRGAGQSFDILPSQNATGNFVKVVQRVPVKIVFDRLPDAAHPIGPGMSVHPHVRVQ